MIHIAKFIRLGFGMILIIMM